MILVFSWKEFMKPQRIQSEQRVSLSRIELRTSNKSLKPCYYAKQFGKIMYTPEYCHELPIIHTPQE
jgi:hypothetical protein